MTDPRTLGITREYGEPFLAFDNSWAFESITRGRGSNNRPWKSSYTRKGYASKEAAIEAIGELQQSDLEA